jgi:hypothetical protein
MTMAFIGGVRRRFRWLVNWRLVSHLDSEQLNMLLTERVRMPNKSASLVAEDAADCIDPKPGGTRH